MTTTKITSYGKVSSAKSVDSFSWPFCPHILNKMAFNSFLPQKLVVKQRKDPPILYNENPIESRGALPNFSIRVAFFSGPSEAPHPSEAATSALLPSSLHLGGAPTCRLTEGAPSPHRSPMVRPHSSRCPVPPRCANTARGTTCSTHARRAHAYPAHRQVFS